MVQNSLEKRALLEEKDDGPGRIRTREPLWDRVSNQQSDQLSSGLKPGAFDELGPGAVQHFKHMIDCIDAFLDLLADSKTDFWAKLMCYGRLRVDVLEFCRFYAKWLGSPLMEGLKHEICELLEEAISWWGEREVYDGMGV